MTTATIGVPHILAQVCGGHVDADPGARLADLGVDSLGRVLLAVLLEEATGRPVPDAALRQLVTVADVARLMEGGQQ